MYMLRSLSNDTKKCDTQGYTSFFQPLIRWKRAVGELTQHVRQTTSEVSEQDVGQRTVYDNDDGDDDGYGDDDDDDDANADDNKWYWWCKAI